MVNINKLNVVHLHWHVFIRSRSLTVPLDGARQFTVVNCFWLFLQAGLFNHQLVAII